MEPSEERRVLVGLSLLEGMPEEAKERVAGFLLDVSETVSLAEGDTLLRQGDLAGDSGYLLVAGEVTINKEGTEPVGLSAPALLGEMHQFNPQARRTATVRAKGPAQARKFSWLGLYARATEALPEDEQTLLMDGIERVVWERFDRDVLMDLPMLRGLGDQLKLRVCLPLLWIVSHEVLYDGEVLFEQNEKCGAAGYLLIRGKMEFTKAGRHSHVLAAPNNIGVMPEFDPELRWTATAAAQGEVELLRFSWLVYNKMLEQRLSEADRQQFAAAMKAAKKDCFTH